MSGKSYPQSEFLPDWAKHLEQYEKVDPKTKIERVRSILKAAGVRRDKTTTPSEPPPAPPEKKPRQKQRNA